MSQVQNISVSSQEGINQNSQQTVSYDEIVNNLVTQGLPQAFNPNTYLSRIAADYNISEKDARNCLKLAIKELEKARNEKPARVEVQTPSQTEVEAEHEEPEVFAQCGYFYPRESKAHISLKQDGMDNLNAYGCYNRLMFGIA